MGLLISRLRCWFALGAIIMIATVAGMYFYAQWRLQKTVHNIPAKVGLDIKQTAEGFSISKSAEGRTLFTVSASKAVQFIDKKGGRAELHNVKIIIYGKDAGRFDQIAGDDFEYDPATGNVSAKGTVLIDLVANPQGLRHSDQSPPEQPKDPIHLETNGLIFNKNTGDATASGMVIFQTPQATGSAVGIEYVAKTSTMKLLSAIEMRVNQPQSLRLTADHGVISKQPRQVELTGARLTREQQQLRAEHATFFLRDDNTVDRVIAEGGVESEFHGRSLANSKTSNSGARARSDRAELFLTGTRNQLTTAILSGNVQLATADTSSRVSSREQSQGEQAHGDSQQAEADAGRVTLRFGAQQILRTVHAEDGVRLSQKKSQGVAAAIVMASAVTSPLITGGAQNQGQNQDIEMTAPVMDFIVKDGHLLQRAETSGPPQIVITQPGANQKTIITAARFTAKFTDKVRLASLHGEPDAKIVAGKISDRMTASPAQSDRVSTSQMLDVIFRPEGGIASIAQSGGVSYVDGPQKAWAQRGEYTATDQMLVLTGAPRVVDNGMTTTAQSIRLNRTTGDAIAEGNVKSTYSDLKTQPDGGMLASSDPIHVTSHTMTAHHSPAVAVYSGDARLWQNANVVEAPILQFDRDKRSLVAEGAAHSTLAQPVSTVLVQADKNGKVTPVNITSAHLNYDDAGRKIVLNGGVTAKGNDATLSGQQMTVFLLPRSQFATGPRSTTPGQVDRIEARGNIMIAQPNRHATGDRLIYTAADDSFILTGGSPSIFDAERGKITGDSLTFFRHDDRVLVEGKETSPTVTRTQVAR
jgi:lipopolysaccharide export system protein LptA